MVEIIAPSVQAAGVLIGAIAILFSGARIAMATAAVLAIKNNDRDLAIAMMRHSTKVPKENNILEENLLSLPKGKSDV